MAKNKTRKTTKSEVAYQKLSQKEEQLKSLLGDEYDVFVSFRDREEQKNLKVKARELAVAMVSKGGKYFEDYNTLEARLDVIWTKAQLEANKEMGLEEAPEKPEKPEKAEKA